MGIHPTAIIDPSAELGDGVEVGPYAIIERDVQIGAGTYVGPYCLVGAGTSLGRENRLFSSAQIGILPQDLKHVPGIYGKTIIGDKNDFREFVTVSSGTGWPTQTPLPRSVCARVSWRISSLPMLATGRHSVAP